MRSTPGPTVASLASMLLCASPVAPHEAAAQRVELAAAVGRHDPVGGEGTRRVLPLVSLRGGWLRQEVERMDGSDGMERSGTGSSEGALGALLGIDVSP